MARRPRPGEDDLEAMLKEFEKGRLQPAAAVVKRVAEAAPAAGESKKTRSKFARDRDAGRAGSAASVAENKEETVGNEEMEVDEGASQLVLRGIVERDVTRVTAVAPAGGSGRTSADFPPILKIADTRRGAGGPSKRSIFAEQFMKMKSGHAAADILTCEGVTTAAGSIPGTVPVPTKHEVLQHADPVNIYIRSGETES